MSALDVDALSVWVGERLPGDGPLTAERIEGGASNEMFRLERGTDVWVLRRPPLHRTSKTSQNVSREVRLLDALTSTDVRVPRVVLRCDDADVIGSPFYVMEFIDGFTPRDPLPSPFDDHVDARYELGVELIDGLAAVANVDWRAVGLDGFGKPEGFLERQVPRWLSQLETYKTRDIPGIDEVARWLEGNIPRAQEPAIIHGDYQFINVMFAHGAPARLAAIVDWEQATIGDPLLDLGWVIAGWSEPDEPLRFGSKYFRDRRGLPSRAELVERYAKITGRDVERLDYYIVLSLFKLACVLEGSYYRFAVGKSTHAMHEKMGPLVLDAIVQASETARTGRW